MVMKKNYKDAFAFPNQETKQLYNLEEQIFWFLYGKPRVVICGAIFLAVGKTIVQEKPLLVAMCKGICIAR